MSETDSPISPLPPTDPPPAAPSRGAITVRPPSPENMWTELVLATNYLTRLNLPLKEDPKPRAVRRAMTWFPLIGALIGLFGAGIQWFMSELGLSAIVTATFAVIGMLWITRALHEEEFASLANQYGQAFDKEQKIGWLKEERSIRYGTLAVIFAIVMKLGAVAGLGSNDAVFQSLIAAECWSRALMVVAAAWLRPLADDPVADHFQQPPAFRVLLTLVLGGLITYLALDTDAAMTMGIGAGAGLVVLLLGANHLRGYNGPLLGTLQQVVELAMLAYILSIQ